MSLRVLHSTPVWLPQTQPWLHDLVRFLPQQVESHVASESTDNLDQFPFPTNRLHVATVPRGLDKLAQRVLWRLGRPPAARHVRATAVRVRPHIVHSHFGPRGWTDRQAVSASGAHHVTSFYGADLQQLPRVAPKWLQRYRELFRDVDRVIVLGDWMAGQVRELGCPSEKVVIQPTGVDVAALPFRPWPGLSKLPIKLLMVASFREKKGIPYGLEAAARLRERGPVMVTIIGGASADLRSTAERDCIMATIGRLDLSESVSLLGYRPHSEVLVQAIEHDIFLAPSVTAEDGDSEGTPVTIMEMMALGIPVVSTMHADIPSIVDHGRTGRLAPERDVGALVEQLHWLIDNDSEVEEIVVRARAHIERKFDVATQGPRLAAVYREVTGIGSGD